MSSSDYFPLFPGLPSDIRKIQILNYLPTSTILSLCQTNKDYYQICQNPRTWILLIQKDFDIDYSGEFPRLTYFTLLEYKRSGRDASRLLSSLELDLDFIAPYLRSFLSQYPLKNVNILRDYPVYGFYLTNGGQLSLQRNSFHLIRITVNPNSLNIFQATLTPDFLQAGFNQIQQIIRNLASPHWTLPRIESEISDLATRLLLPLQFRDKDLVEYWQGNNFIYFVRTKPI